LKNEFQNLPPELRQKVSNAIEEMNEPMTVEQVREMLRKNEKGTVKNTIGNCLTAFQHDPYLAGALAFNLLAVQTHIVKPLWYERHGGSALSDTDMTYIRLYLEETYGLTNEKKIEDAAVVAAHEHSFHPVRDFLSGLKWDGQERIRNCLHHFLGADNDDYTYEVLRLFLLGAIHRAFCPGCKFDYMLCLVGGQGAGKSTFFRFLATRDEWFSDDLRKLDDDHVFERLQSHWIIEMSEMIATANAKSIEETKSFLSRQKENYRMCYGKYPADRLRQCVFGGTSNTMDFLPLDRSGNRRFLPVLVKQEEAEVHILQDEAESRAYIEQVWAEAMCIYRSGNWELKPSPEVQQLLKDHQKDFMPEDTKAGMIQGFLDQYQGNAVCSKLLYKEALNHPFDDAKSWDLREICDIMNQSITGWRYFKNPRSFSGYGRQRGWERIPPATKSDNNAEIHQQNMFEGFVALPDDEDLPF
jgi:predicted P-loop ATPase